MQRLTLARGIPEDLKGSIVALGNFDGFHLGHQAVVGRAIQRGFHERRPVVVATFDPHPVRFFKPDLPPFRLTTLDQREALFAYSGADAMLVFEFGETLRSTSAEDFVVELLAHQIGAAGVVTGDDFTFGNQRGGNVELLRTLGAEHGIVAEAVAPVLLGDTRISSGRVREALQAGDTATATRLLSRDFTIAGTVQRGDQRGRELGYPTANVAVPDRICLPTDGVYAGTYVDQAGVERPAAISLGRRPTFYEDSGLRLLEAHVLDFDGDLYDQRAAVRFRAHLRGQERFDRVDALIEQMGRDVDDARRILTS
jgi:riboflavin kinase / FMN adenylyltransferase